jgi:hypothetical protein
VTLCNWFHTIYFSCISGKDDTPFFTSKFSCLAILGDPSIREFDSTFLSFAAVYCCLFELVILPDDTNLESPTCPETPYLTGGPCLGESWQQPEEVPVALEQHLCQSGCSPHIGLDLEDLRVGHKGERSFLLDI